MTLGLLSYYVHKDASQKKKTLCSVTFLVHRHFLYLFFVGVVKRKKKGEFFFFWVVEYSKATIPKETGQRKKTVKKNSFDSTHTHTLKDIMTEILNLLSGPIQ